MGRYNFKFIDLFAGIGGFHQAMTFYGGKCVFASEIDDQCQKTYERQFKMKVHGDINKCLDEIPEFDVLCGGFPCQTFSKAGNQEGFDDEIKGQLFFRIVDILKRHPECKFVILENVRNLADDENFWNVIQKELLQLNFYITKEPIIKSPDYFGIPQNRERVYILGIKKELRDTAKLLNGWIHINDLNLELFKKECKPGTAFSVLEYGCKDNSKYVSEEENAVIGAWEEFKKEILPHKQIGSPIWIDFFGIGIDDDDIFKNQFNYYTQLRKAKKKELNDPTLFSSITENGYIKEDTPAWKRMFIDKNRKLYKENKAKIDDWYHKYQSVLNKKTYRKFEWNCGPNYIDFKDCILQFRQSGLRIKKSDTFPSLVAIVNTPIIWDVQLKKYRRLTVREAANLQSFRKNYRFISDERQSYKQLGNSVNVKVIKIITGQLFNLGIDNWDRKEK